VSDRNVRLVVLSRFVSRVGGEAAFFVGLWGKVAFEMGGSLAEIAPVMAALGVSTIAGSAISGVLVDRYDPRRLLIVGEVFFVPATLSILLAETPAQLVGFSLVLGFFSAPVFTAAAAFAPYLTTDDAELQRVNSRLESAALAAVVFGPALGAIAVRYASLDWVFVLDAATSVVGMLLVLPVRVRDVARVERSGAFGEIISGLRLTYGLGVLRYLVVMSAALWTVFGIFSALEPVFFRDVVGTSIESIGWVNTVFGVGLVAGAMALPRLPRQVSTLRGIGALVILNGAAVLLYAGTNRLAVVVAGGLTWGVLIGVLIPLGRTLLQWNTPEEVVGRVTGSFQMHSQAGQLIPLIFVPWLAATFGVQTVMVATGVVLAIVGAIGVPIARKLDRAVSPPPRNAVLGLGAADEPISPVG
jgi:MFS family permease